jgi:hypothetical protein
LNHDVLIERLFADSGIPFVDGFGEPGGDVRYFEPGLFESSTKVRLFKLHGSINWFRFRDEHENPFSDRYGIPTCGDPEHCKDKAGKLLNNVDVIPWIIAGTHNKATEYGFGVYAEMHFWFHKLLKEHRAIAMSGYGWNDRGINGRLMEWLHSPEQKHLILMHEKLDDLASYSRSSLWNRYQPLVDAGRITAIPKWLENVGVEELLIKVRGIAA